ncbi:MAG TPA: PDZ domain-containing protein [Candidatus Binataceae bacterium]|nr:PDZ domain-containing protein [Candidatus Binataceae bacterium]
MAGLAAALFFGAAAICHAQAAPDAQASGNQLPGAGDHGGVLEIAPQSPPPPQQAKPSTAAPEDRNGAAQGNANDQQGGDETGSENNDVELYRTYTDSEHASGRSGPLPYLGISVHSTTVTQANGVQQRALEVLSVDQGSPAAAAAIKGSGAATNLGASSLTASAMFGPAQELLAPLLKKTGQLGRQGDLIVAVDDNRVGSEQELAEELARLKPGDTMWLTVLRESAKGKPQAVKVPIKLAPPRAPASTSAAN